MTELAKPKRTRKVAEKIEAAEAVYVSGYVEPDKLFVKDQTVSEAPAYPVTASFAKGHDATIAAICAHYQAAVKARDGAVVVFERGLTSGAINLDNYETAEDAIKALRTTALGN